MVVALVAAVHFSTTGSALLLVATLACAHTADDTTLSVMEELQVQSPDRGSLLYDDTVTVRGRVSDPSQVDRVRVLDRTVQIEADGSFELQLTVAPGLNLLHTVARLHDGTELVDTRAVLAGPRAHHEALAERGVRARLSAETVGTIGESVALAMSTTDWGPVLASSGPTGKTGTGCFAASATIDDLDIGSASMQTTPIPGGLDVELTLRDVRARASASYEAACLAGTTSLSFTADDYTVHATVALSAIDGDVRSSVEVHYSDIDDLAVVVTGIDFIDEAMTNVDFLAGPVLGWLIEAQLGPMLETALEDFSARPMTIPVADTELVVRTHPEVLSFDHDGGRIEVATAVFVPGADSPGYPLSAVDTPVAAQPGAVEGFDLRVTDEVFNQTLTALWSSKLLTQEIDPAALGSTDFGGALDQVFIDAKLPPTVRLGEREESPVLVVGDLIVELRGPKYTHARIAVSAEVALSAVERPDLGDGITVLQPSSELQASWINVLEVDERSRSILDEALVEAITESVVARAAADLGELTGFITIPCFGGTTLVAPRAFSRPGYLQLEGRLGVAE